MKNIHNVLNDLFSRMSAYDLIKFEKYTFSSMNSVCNHIIIYARLYLYSKYIHHFFYSPMTNIDNLKLEWPLICGWSKDVYSSCTELSSSSVVPSEGGEFIARVTTFPCSGSAWCVRGDRPGQCKDGRQGDLDPVTDGHCRASAWEGDGYGRDPFVFQLATKSVGLSCMSTGWHEFGHSVMANLGWLYIF